MSGLGWQNVLNVTGEGVALAFLMLLVLYLHRSESVHRSKQRSFLIMVSVFIVILAADIVYRFWEGKPGHLAYVVLQCSVFLLYLGYIVGAIVYLNYILQYTGQPKDKARIPISFLLIFTLSNVMLLVTTLFNGFFYYFDANNYYHRASGMQYLAITLVIEIISALVVLIIGRKQMPFIERVSSYFFAAIPLAAGVLQYFYSQFTFVNITVGVAAFILYFNIQARREREYYRQQKEMTDQQIALMMSQIQPHFLYNAISSIRELCLVDPTEARIALGDFAMYLRSNMDSLKTTGFIPFEKELDHVRHYLKIEQLRFGDLLQVEYDLETTDFEIPSLCLEPIVENAVKHGTCSKDEGGTVTISTRVFGDSVEITVKDDGTGFNCPSFDEIPFKDDGRSHIGIWNVKTRVEDLAHGSFSFESEKGVGTTVTIVIPLV